EILASGVRAANEHDHPVTHADAVGAVGEAHGGGGRAEPAIRAGGDDPQIEAFKGVDGREDDVRGLVQGRGLSDFPHPLVVHGGMLSLGGPAGNGAASRSRSEPCRPGVGRGIGVLAALWTALRSGVRVPRMPRTSTALTALAQLLSADVRSRAQELARAEQDLEGARADLAVAERALERWRGEVRASVAAEEERLGSGERRASEWVRQEQYQAAAARRGEVLLRARDEALDRLRRDEKVVRDARRALAEAHGKKEAVERCLSEGVRLAAGRAARTEEEDAAEGALARRSAGRSA